MNISAQTIIRASNTVAFTSLLTPERPPGLPLQFSSFLSVLRRGLDQISEFFGLNILVDSGAFSGLGVKSNQLVQKIQYNMGDFRKQAKLTFPLKKKESSEFKPIFVVHITSESLENIIHAGSQVHPLVIRFREKLNRICC